MKESTAEDCKPCGLAAGFVVRMAGTSYINRAGASWVIPTKAFALWDAWNPYGFSYYPIIQLSGVVSMQIAASKAHDLFNK
jgi:hypothetical protein